jgi:hypothetical protein
MRKSNPTLNKTKLKLIIKIVSQSWIPNSQTDAHKHINDKLQV